jgi:hypothetical protein
MGKREGGEHAKTDAMRRHRATWRKEQENEDVAAFPPLPRITVTHFSADLTDARGE